MKNTKKCTPETILPSGKGALVCNFAKNPDASVRTNKLSEKYGDDVSTHFCPFHKIKKNLPKGWR